MLTRTELMAVLEDWTGAWARHDLDGVMNSFHDDAVFEHWTGSTVRGKAALREAWTSWFSDHGHFRFTDEAVVADEVTQTALWRWSLEWPSHERGAAGAREVRRGVDVIRFEDGLLIEKLTYSKTAVQLDGRPVRLALPSLEA
jgi:ketosteroid isomerase-like protein